jgi:hypothetical protein
MKLRNQMVVCPPKLSFLPPPICFRILELTNPLQKPLTFTLLFRQPTIFPSMENVGGHEGCAESVQEDGNVILDCCDSGTCRM